MSRYPIFLSLLTIAVICISCDKESDFYKLNLRDKNEVDQILKFTVLDPAEIEADNSSSALIEIKISPQTDSIYREVLLMTDRGRFDNGNDSIRLYINYDGAGKTRLVSSNEIGYTIIKAKVQEIMIDTLVYFTYAFPSDYLLSASSYVVDSGQITMINAILYRENGNVTNELKVNFSVLKNDSISVYPLVPQYGLVKNDSAKVEIVNPFNAKGLFTILSKVPVSENDSLEKKILIDFK